MTTDTLGGVDRQRIAELFAAEQRKYVAAHPVSQQRTGHGIAGFYDGVPMHWMRDWSMPFPFLVASAHGSTLRDVDGNEYADFCLGDTGSMFGHSPAPVAAAIARQARRGLTYMLPTDDAVVVGQLLVDASDCRTGSSPRRRRTPIASRLRVARAVTGRPKILVFNGCYHGIGRRNLRAARGQAARTARPACSGRSPTSRSSPASSSSTTSQALERELAHGDVACVIAEPVMTNSCMVLPEPGFLEALRRLTRDSGHAAADRRDAHDLDRARAATRGPMASSPTCSCSASPSQAGCPPASGACHEAVARRLDAVRASKPPGHSGMGTTLSANALALAAMRATLEHVMTDAAYATMERLAGVLVAGLQEAIAARRLPWHAVRVGARVEFICAPGPLRDGTQGEAAHAPAARARHPPGAAEPWLPDRTVPQHDAGVPGHDRAAGCVAAGSVRRSGRCARCLIRRPPGLEYLLRCHCSIPWLPSSAPPTC